MQELISLLKEEVVFSFLLLFARILAFMAFMPVFSHVNVSSNLRIALSFYVTIFLFPIITINPQINSDNFILAILSEITLGGAAAFLVNIVFSAVRVTGELIGYATALSMANMFDPATQTQEGVVSRFLYLVALMIFFETGLYELTVLVLVKSFDMIRLGTFDLFSYNGIMIAIEEIKRMFAFAFAFAFPLFFIGFIMDVYYGYGTKSMPAFSPFVITFQLKFTLIFLFMMFGMEIFAENFKDYFLTRFN